MKRLHLIVCAASLARIIVYSMAPDGLPTPSSAAPTPAFTPFASGTSTPLPQQNGGLGDYLSAPLNKGARLKGKTYLAGCKALDALVKLIASTEGFFHPTNSGSWTNDVCLLFFCVTAVIPILCVSNDVDISSSD